MLQIYYYKSRFQRTPIVSNERLPNNPIFISDNNIFDSRVKIWFMKNLAKFLTHFFKFERVQINPQKKWKKKKLFCADPSLPGIQEKFFLKKDKVYFPYLEVCLPLSTFVKVLSSEDSSFVDIFNAEALS